ncbi:hypothetical protein ACROYT_G007074 [Oculina patagonica]
MAAVVGHYKFWNITSEQALEEAWLSLENVQILSGISVFLSIVMSPIIVFGNVLVLLAVWKDPLKKLRSSPSNLILTSMAIADLLVGLVVCPITAYWGWVICIEEESPFDLSVIFAINVFSVNVSFGHMFLLTVDRVFAVVTPLHYRVRVTNKRVIVANCVCWIYFVMFGCAFLMLRDYFAIIGAVYNVQLHLIFLIISDAQSFALGVDSETQRAMYCKRFTRKDKCAEMSLSVGHRSLPDLSNTADSLQAPEPVSVPFKVENLRARRSASAILKFFR